MNYIFIFFFVKKALLVSYDEATSDPTGALCLNYKRGGAVKIGPVVVDAERRGQERGPESETAGGGCDGCEHGSASLFANPRHFHPRRE